MKNIKIIEPFTGNIAGAQKITLNVAGILSEKNILSVVARNNNSKLLKSLLNLNCPVDYFPFESLIKNIVGSGDFSPNSKGVFFKIKMIALLVFMNIYTLYLSVRDRSDYIYCYDQRGLMFCIFILILNRKTKVVWHLHSEISYGKKIFKFLTKFIHLIITPSDSLTRRVISSLETNEGTKTVTIYNGFDFCDYNITDNIVGDTLSICFVGSIVPHKGLHNLLLAVENIHHETNKKITIHVVGDYLDNNSLYKTFIKNMVASSSAEIVMYGWLNNPINVLRNCDLLVFPSVIDQTTDFGNGAVHVKSSEALPTVLIESLAYGVPVIAVNTPGANEIVNTACDGILLDESDQDLLKSAIIEFINKNDAYIVDVNGARSKFSWCTMRKAILEQFN